MAELVAVAAAAAGLSATEAFGVLAGTLGIIGFLENNFGQPVESISAVVRIQVGLASLSGQLTQADGDLPDVRNFNDAAEPVGTMKDPGHVDDGSFVDFKVSQERNQQPTYTLFTANYDAICIALATIVWPDGQKFAWTGGFARLCDLEW